MEEKVNYDEFVLDPKKDVLVPIGTYVALTNLVDAVEKQHSKRIRSDKYAMYNNKTHERLSDKSRHKMKPEKLAKEYYENIDYDATSKNVRIDRDELGSAAIRLLGEFRGIFRHNVDNGNGVLRAELNPPTDGPGPTLVKDES